MISRKINKSASLFQIYTNLKKKTYKTSSMILQFKIFETKSQEIVLLKN